MEAAQGYKERIDGKNYLVIPVHASALFSEVLRRVNAALGRYCDMNYRESGFPGAETKRSATRKYPLARLHALLPDRIVYEVEV